MAGAERALNRSEAWFVLNGLQTIGPVSIRRLLDAFGSDPVRLFNATRRELEAVDGIGPKASEVICHWWKCFDLEKENHILDKFDACFIDRENGLYPSALLEIYDPPTGLYRMGSLPLEQRGVAIVGSRSCSLYGQRVARKLASCFARRGFCIISGLARGIDTAAHEGALEVGGKTVAVLGNGLDIIYPPENLGLYREIVEKGAVVSEFRFGRRADRQTFPMRNRLVSGMARLVVVVETDLRGGSMITARFALEQGRTVAAVPGRIDDPQSRGCLQLIQDGAVLVHSVEALVDEYAGDGQMDWFTALGGAGSGEKGEDSSLADACTPSEREVLNLFSKGDALGIDSLSEKLGKPSHEVAGILVLLEMKRLVGKRSDGSFERR
ncbi:MAG: DNA-processing protein DprA [Puniceicoccaceae bacterium]